MLCMYILVIVVVGDGRLDGSCLSVLLEEEEEGMKKKMWLYVCIYRVGGG